jgi:hypothetical protein
VTGVNVENRLMAHLREGGAIPLDVAAMALIKGAFLDLDRGMSGGEEAALAARIRVAILHGGRDAKVIAVEALQAEGWPARYEVRGELGRISIRPRTQ